MAKRTCSVPSCPDLVRCRDLCNRHYRRLRKYGSPTGSAAQRSRFVGKSGYVRVKLPGHPESDARGWALEHRVVAHDTFGPIPAGHHVHHKNHDKADNRPENLSVLSPEAHHSEHRVIDRDAVERLYRSGLGTVAVAAEVGTDPGNVSRILAERRVPTRAARRPRVDVDDRRLRDLHGRPGYRVPQIAAELGVGTWVVRRRMRELGLPSFPSGYPK